MDFIFDPSLVLYLPLWKLNGASFMSKDTYGHLCTVTGALWRPDGHYFDGTDDKLTIPDAPSLRLEHLTLDGWVSVVSGGVAVVSKAYSASRVAYKLLATTNYVFVQILDEDGTTEVGADHVVATGSGIYHHLAATYDGSILRFYVNGVEEDTNECGEFTIPHSTREVTIGARYEGGWLYGEGVVGESRVYNRALTPQEIQNIYLATRWRYR